MKIPSKKSNSTQHSSRKDTCAPTEDHLSPGDFIVVVGLAILFNGQIAIAIKLLNQSNDQARLLPIILLGKSRSSQLEEWLIANGFTAVAFALTAKEIATFLRASTAACKQHVFSREGFHDLPLNGTMTPCLVKFGECWGFGKLPTEFKIVLTGTAARGSQTKCSSIASFNENLSQDISQNPRLIVPIYTALAAIVKRMFDATVPNIGIICGSSLGKSTIQKVSAILVNGANKIQTMNATTIGLHEFLVNNPDEAVFIEDAHGLGAGQPLISAIMNTVNGGFRMVSRRGDRGDTASPVTSIIIHSAERNLMETALLCRSPISSGVYARYIEIGQGAHGMFDNLGKWPNGQALSKHLVSKSMEFPGLLGREFVKRLSEDWPSARNMWKTRRLEIRSRILKAAGGDEGSPISSRLLDSLVFPDFVGCLVNKYKIAEVSMPAVHSAFGLVFREHLEQLRRTASPVAQTVIDAVALYIRTHARSFAPLGEAGQDSERNGITGYLRTSRSGKRQYLFIPQSFDKLFVSQFGSECFAHLRAAGHLFTQEGRHNQVQVRIPNTDRRQFFIAIEGAITDAENR